MNTKAVDVVKPDQLPVPEAASVLQIIERAASSPDVDVDKMEKLLAMHERIVARQAEAAFAQALNQAQAESTRVSADAENPQTRSRYASYAQLDRALRPIYTRHGFSLIFDTADHPLPEYVRVLCHVSHSAGHTRTVHIDMPADGKGAKGGDVMTKTHAAGSAMSYGMRYLLKMIFNVAVGESDDDGNSASGERITAKQAADLEALASEVGANMPAFKRYLRVDDLSDLPASRYAGAVAALEAKRAK